MSNAAPCVLIVDPDEHFRAALAAEALSVGLGAICCADWWDAKGILEGPTVIDGMIVELDQPMGTPNGLSVALMARARRRHLPVVFTSLDPELLKEVRPGTGVILAKSVGVNLLVQSTKELIETDRRKAGRPIPHLAPVPRLSLSPVARYHLDRDIRIRSLNDSAVAMWGKSPNELLGRGLLDVFPHMDGQPKFRAHLDVLARREPYKGRFVSVVLQEQINIHIAPDRAGLRVSFALAA